LPSRVWLPQAHSCAQYLRNGSRVFVDAEPDPRESTDEQQNKREAVTFRARQVRFEGAPRAIDAGNTGEARDNGSPAPGQPALEVGAATSVSEGTAPPRTCRF
jgi:single-stranded DNA-binding protein